MSDLTSFSLFTSFPPEIIGLIISTCPVNDQICLRLTCKFLYNFPTLTKISEVPLSHSEIHPCEWRNPPSGARCSHNRQMCHEIAYKNAVAQAERQGLRPPARTRRRCFGRRWWGHCECYEGELSLHRRLAPWMPRGLKYCDACVKFTRRKKAHNNRCYHGQPKPRKMKTTWWTYRTGRGGFGRKLWKRWFNNAAMNSLESELREGRDGNNRCGAGRYAMRTLKAKEVDTREERNNFSLVC
ncbi:hypothetical protein F5884DRAFT_796950 [Xylogone sp. PMI_703]|nr:hypothetical protein F5884DRAFT_796950 [Xylogone sp. PMI_703]